MTSWSDLAWRNLRSLWGLQFPWRLNVLLGIAATGLVALAADELKNRSLSRVILAAAGWVVLTTGTARAFGLQRHFLHVAPVAALRVEPADNLAGMVPISRIPTEEAYRLPTPSDGLVAVASGEGSARGVLVQPRKLKIDVECRGPCNLLVRQLGYPTWRVSTQTGAALPFGMASATGLMTVNVPVGVKSLLVELPPGLGETMAPWVTAFSALGIVVLFARRQTARA